MQHDDFWHAMNQQARADSVLPIGIDVKSIMDTWTTQAGFPLITITRNYATGVNRIQQVSGVTLIHIQVQHPVVTDVMSLEIVI